MRRLALFLAACLAVATRGADGLAIKVDAHEEECFKDQARPRPPWNARSSAMHPRSPRTSARSTRPAPTAAPTASPSARARPPSRPPLILPPPQVDVGSKMSLAFQVAEGGFLDIDISVRGARVRHPRGFRLRGAQIEGPDGKVVYSGERETDGKYTFAAHMTGLYTYCFGNKMSTMTPKLVVFSFSITPGPNAAPAGGEEEEKEDQHDKLQEMVRELSESLYNIRREQNQMEYRDATHRMINDSTNSRVVWWSFFEALVLVCVTVGQVYYLLRFLSITSRF